MMRYFILIVTLLASVLQADPMPIDPLWKSELFRKTVTGSFGIDSRIEPQITVDEEFYLNKSAKEMAEKDRDAAIKTLAESSLLAESPALLFSLATFEFQAGDLDAAIGHFNQALKRFPNFRDAHRNLAIVLVQKEDFDEAIKHLARSMELGSRESVTMGLLGYCHATQNHHQAALDAYRIAVLTQPAEAQWKIGESQALQALQRPQESAMVLQNLIDDDPSNINLWLVQADNWIALNQPDKAIANLEMGHRAEVLSPDATLSLGHLYLQNDLPELALERYQIALNHSEKTLSLSRAIGAVELLASVNEWERASILSRQINDSERLQSQIKSDGTDRKVLSRLHRQQSLIELEIGDEKVGAKLISDWLIQEPLDGLALILLARFKEESGAREEAEMLLERAEQLPEHAASAHISHGKLLVAISEYTAAIEHLEHSLDLKASASLAEYLEAVRELAP